MKRAEQMGVRGFARRRLVVGVVGLAIAGCGLVGRAEIASAQNVTIPAKTVVRVRTSTVIDSRKADDNELYAAELDQALVVNRRTVAPKGAPAALVVVDTKGAGVGGRASLTLSLAWVEIDGRRVPVQTTEVTDESDSQKGKTIKGGLVGGAIGAAVGGIVGGGSGAAKGAAIGGGAGVGVAILSGQRVQLPAESLLRFTTTRQVRVQGRGKKK